MAVVFVQKLANTRNKTSETSTTLLTAVASTAGNLLVGCIAHLGSTTVSSVTDSAGNTYTSSGSVANGTAVTTTIFASKTTAAIPVFGSFTINWSAATTTKAFVFFEFSGADNAQDVAAGTGTGSSTTPSASLTPTLADDLIVGAVGVNGPTTDALGAADADSAGGDTWHDVASDGTSGAGATSNVVCGWLGAGSKPQVDYKITTSAVAQTYNPTLGTSRAWAAILVTFKASAGIPFSRSARTFVIQVLNRAASFFRRLPIRSRRLAPGF